MYVEGDTSLDRVPIPFQSLEHFLEEYEAALHMYVSIPPERVSFPLGVLAGSVLIPTCFSAGKPSASKLYDEFNKQLDEDLEPYINTNFKQYCDAAKLKVSLSNFYKGARPFNEKARAAEDAKVANLNESYNDASAKLDEAELDKTKLE
eukprot:GHVU01079521.1.p4 GENE.GHVU01079521.1~~GHVU01079521.1.p4  ORF type:complete len:149 (+),score=27.17 GHVU01079521.1:248-694(+)